MYADSGLFRNTSLDLSRTEFVDSSFKGFDIITIFVDRFCFAWFWTYVEEYFAVSEPMFVSFQNLWAGSRPPLGSHCERYAPGGVRIL